MSATALVTAINCTQCGGELHPDQGQVFLTCPFCSSTVYLDKKQVVFHQYLSPTLDEEAARSHLRAWMSGNETVKDLDRKADLLETRFEFFPVWFFKIKTKSGHEKLLVQPAAATAVVEIKTLSIPAGDLRRFDANQVTNAVEPTVPLEAARTWLGQEHPETGTVLETALVHLPIFKMHYEYHRRDYTALVEAGTGRVLAGYFPEKKEMPYQMVSFLSIAGFLILSLVPVFSSLFAENAFEGFTNGIGLYFAFGSVFFVICMVIALFVAAKV